MHASHFLSRRVTRTKIANCVLSKILFLLIKFKKKKKEVG